MCREGPYQTLYLRHAPCMQSVQAEYQQCSTEYQARLRLVQQEGGQSSSQEVELLCCSFQSYLSCSQQVVNSTCGRDTAVFTANCDGEIKQWDAGDGKFMQMTLATVGPWVVMLDRQLPLMMSAKESDF